MEQVEARRLLATFTVLNVADAGPDSLRQAILDANTAPGPDEIRFNIPGPGPFTIIPQTALPTVSDPVVIDGTTQPGFAGRPIIELNGSSPNFFGERADDHRLRQHGAGARDQPVRPIWDRARQRGRRH